MATWHLYLENVSIYCVEGLSRGEGVAGPEVVVLQRIRWRRAYVKVHFLCCGVGGAFESSLAYKLKLQSLIFKDGETSGLQDQNIVSHRDD